MFATMNQPVQKKALPNAKDGDSKSSRPRKSSFAKKQDPGRIILGTGNLCPANTGTYGLVSQVEVTKGLERIASQQVLVETIEEESGDKSKDMDGDAKAVDHAVANANDPGKKKDAPPGCMAPTVHSLSSKRHSAGDETQTNQAAALLARRRADSDPTLTIEIEPLAIDDVLDTNYRMSKASSTTKHEWAQAWGSNNSWAPVKSYAHLGNSFANSVDHHSALPLPLIPKANPDSVPPPPAEYPGYISPSGPPSPRLAAIELRFHYAMDVFARRMEKMVVDKLDKCTDEILKKHDLLEESLHRLEQRQKALTDDTNNEIKLMIRGVEMSLKVIEQRIAESESRQKAVEDETSGSAITAARQLRNGHIAGQHHNPSSSNSSGGFESGTAGEWLVIGWAIERIFYIGSPRGGGASAEKSEEQADDE
ncbi:MAG: hypothetical protein MMC33_004616 [Icmadophila ericetorum]|nr:hypothetical protein [Icmadophila ericetorum]